MPKINLMQFDNEENNISNTSDNDMLVNNEEIIEHRNNIKHKNIPKQKNKKTRKKSNLRKFLVSFTTTLVIFLTFIFGVFYAYDNFYRVIDPTIEEYNGDNSKYDTDKALLGAKDQYNFAFFGVDNESSVNPRTDFMVIGSYNRKTNKVKLMSVPRDTLAVMPQERIQNLKDKGIATPFPSSGKMKLNEVHHHATDEYGSSYLLAQLEEMFEVDFDFYVKFDLDGFKYFVDEIGGVPFNVPQRMYYNDPDQDLYVDLQEGYQTLNGEQAEGVVRYRHADEKNPISSGYARGDLDRIEVQHDFMEAFVKQLSSKSNLAKTLPAMLQATQKYCETNFKLTDLPIYLPFLTNFTTENLEIYTMPNKPSGDYVAPVQPDTAELIDEIFYSNELQTPKVSSKGLNIEVLNGTYTSGLASKTADLLKENGFTVSNVGDYNGEKQNQTKIYVKDRAYGDDLKKFFTSPKIVNDPSQTADIVIVIGLDQS